MFRKILMSIYSAILTISIVHAQSESNEQSNPVSDEAQQFIRQVEAQIEADFSDKNNHHVHVYGDETEEEKKLIANEIKGWLDQIDSQLSKHFEVPPKTHTYVLMGKGANRGGANAETALILGFPKGVRNTSIWPTVFGLLAHERGHQFIWHNIMNKLPLSETQTRGDIAREANLLAPAAVAAEILFQEYLLTREYSSKDLYLQTFEKWYRAIIRKFEESNDRWWRGQTIHSKVMDEFLADAIAIALTGNPQIFSDYLYYSYVVSRDEPPPASSMAKFRMRDFSGTWRPEGIDDSLWRDSESVLHSNLSHSVWSNSVWEITFLARQYVWKHFFSKEDSLEERLKTLKVLATTVETRVPLQVQDQTTYQIQDSEKPENFFKIQAEVLKEFTNQMK